MTTKKELQAKIEEFRYWLGYRVYFQWEIQRKFDELFPKGKS